MEQSATYRAIVRRSRVEEARRVLLLQVEEKFGLPDEAGRATIENMTDLAQLEDLLVRLLSAGGWDELLAPRPGQRRRNVRRRPRG